MSISTNIVSVTFGNSRRACGDRILHQRDRGQVLTFSDLADQLPPSFQVWFANHPEIGTAVPQTGSGGNVAIPDTLIATGQPIWAWLYLHTGADDGETCYTVTILNTVQPAFTGATPTPSQASAWDEAIAELNEAIEAAEAAAEHGPEIRDGYWYTWDAETQEYKNTEVPATGNKIWWTSALISIIPLSRYTAPLPYLNGPVGSSPAVSDLVVGPAPGTSGSATYLYYIFGVDTTLQTVILKSIGSIKGVQGDPGPAGPSGGQFWTAKSASTSPDYTWSFSNLIGPDDETPAVGDIIFYSIYRYTVASVDLQNQKVTCTARTSLRGQQGPAGQGVPVGGDQAQILSKKSATDYDTQWSDLIALLPSTFKAALLQLAQKVAYIDAQGADYYQDLYDALYPPKELVSISAVFTQGQTVVYDTDSLDSLKTMLVVTGTYDDQSTETIPSTGYTLSGTLTPGTSTITVTCDGKTTTFTVQVTHQPGVYAVTNNLTGCSNSNTAASVTDGGSYSGTITASSGYTLTGATVSITMGGTDITGIAYSNGTISIASVSGALVITVTAVAVTLSSISAVYTQSGTVYTDDTLDSLKADLVVTAVYSDSSTQTVPAADYTLSGTLTSGTSTITVSYGGKTTTFSVTVTAPLYSIPDFVEQSVTSGGTYRVSKTNGIYTVSGNAAGVLYIDPNGAVSSTKSSTLWFKTIQDKPISSQISEIEWENLNTTAVNLDVKYSQSGATGNLATASFAMSANGSGTDGYAAYENDAYNERNLSGIAIQFSRTSGTGAFANQITASFKIRLFVDGVRYL